MRPNPPQHKVNIRIYVGFCTGPVWFAQTSPFLVGFLNHGILIQNHILARNKTPKKIDESSIIYGSYPTFKLDLSDNLILSAILKSGDIVSNEGNPIDLSLTLSIQDSTIINTYLGEIDNPIGIESVTDNYPYYTSNAIDL